MTDTFHVTGGGPLHGEIAVSGAKNAASKMLIATLLTEESVELTNVPRQHETEITQEIIEAVGSKVEWVDEHTVHARASVISSSSVRELSRKNRISVLAIAPLLHRTGEAFVPLVGGDKIGPRPVNWHLDALMKMGVKIEATSDGYHAHVDGRLTGALVELPYPSVGATEQAILAAVLADGRTTIHNAAGEPEIKGLIMMLQSMGAMIQINSGRQIEIIGVEKLSGCKARVMPDRIEAASYGSLALGTRGEIFVRDAEHEHMITFLNAVRKIGGEYEVQPGGILFKGVGDLKGIELETDTHPGFMTDWQQPFVVALTQAQGTSIVHETVYEGRFGYTKALIDMGADITLFSNCLGEVTCRFKGQNHKHSAVITGPKQLHAAEIEVPDIRAGLAFVVAALVAEGTSVLTGIHHLDRGYERLQEKLMGVGAKMERSK
ncbi:UDP-N-acetylglucosamine 1-carboxyvinyltransferase [Candidatus Uhrbacteria bacterium CG_4_9_14_3_um_filter_50_9]|uniref:UDP-N-acetylglucosamine 1-carboxyvinyltransferase n=1 Tax=Candidatus Uhrbacteria bacterium CG_4_9_14_3_um_filter_50_9 TaxID=1975035 RepID=A0A2M7XBP4_9BACT|nr:MAG: UDP-N-acetylglucosamine 1-carboxyvinyltransferase [Candidatus Uhrbacteria bacterium CG_4_9_14_3_um_filter_50_9]